MAQYPDDNFRNSCHIAYHQYIVRRMRRSCGGLYRAPPGHRIPGQLFRMTNRNQGTLRFRDMFGSANMSEASVSVKNNHISIDKLRESDLPVSEAFASFALRMSERPEARTLDEGAEATYSKLKRIEEGLAQGNKALLEVIGEKAAGHTSSRVRGGGQGHDDW